MKEAPITKEMLLNQLEEALEERQNPDRRKKSAGLPPHVSQDRRKGDRRASRANYRS